VILVLLLGTGAGVHSIFLSFVEARGGVMKVTFSFSFTAILQFSVMISLSS
jgi:hypothetical protein